MNKFKTILFGIFGGMNVVVTIILPILISIIWIEIFGLNFSSYVLVVVCGLASIFRAIKIGWLNQ